MISFGANVSGYFLVTYFSRSLDKILIGKYFGAKELGYYHKAFQLFELMLTQFTAPLHSVAVPALSKLRNEPEKYRRYYLNELSGCLGCQPLNLFQLLEPD